jgi:hypothetical protein
MALDLYIEPAGDYLHCKLDGKFNDISDVDEECGEKLGAACMTHQCSRLMLDYSGVVIASEFRVLDTHMLGQKFSGGSIPLEFASVEPNNTQNFAGDHLCTMTANRGVRVSIFKTSEEAADWLAGL